MARFRSIEVPAGFAGLTACWCVIVIVGLCLWNTTDGRFQQELSGRKKLLEEAKKSGKTGGGDASPNECGRTAWTEYLFSAIENTCRRPLDCRASSGLRNFGGDRCFFRTNVIIYYMNSY